jgi:hypothetical protein
VALVIAQAEPALCKRITLRGRSLVEIGGSVVGLRHTEAIFVHEAETRLRSGISAQRLGRQLADCPNVIAPGIGSSPARQSAGVRDRHRAGAEQQNRKQNRRYGPPHSGCIPQRNARARNSEARYLRFAISERCVCHLPRSR